jgi:hypothetical protein
MGAAVFAFLKIPKPFTRALFALRFFRAKRIDRMVVSSLRKTGVVRCQIHRLRELALTFPVTACAIGFPKFQAARLIPIFRKKNRLQAVRVIFGREDAAVKPVTLR